MQYPGCLSLLPLYSAARALPSCSRRNFSKRIFPFIHLVQVVHYLFDVPCFSITFAALKPHRYLIVHLHLAQALFSLSSGSPLSQAPHRLALLVCTRYIAYPSSGALLTLSISPALSPFCKWPTMPSGLSPPFLILINVLDIFVLLACYPFPSVTNSALPFRVIDQRKRLISGQSI